MRATASAVFTTALLLAAAPLPGAWAAEPPADAAAPTDAQTQLLAYEAALENATRRIEALQKELDAARARLAMLEDTLVAAGLDPETGETATLPAEDPRLAQLRREQEEARARVRAIRQQRAAKREAEAARKALAPRWNYTWQIGFLDGPTRKVTYVEQTKHGQVVFVGEKSTVDRRNIVMRGTFENRATRPHRYTFDVGVAEDNPGRGFFSIDDQFTARTRYQTPVLEPGELHHWEVRMSVNDALQIERGGIGNIRGEPYEYLTEAPPPPAASEAPPNTPPAAEPAPPAADPAVHPRP